MKKNLFIFAAVALALASCSKDEIIESAAFSDSNAITFRTNLEGVTRAANGTGVKSSWETGDILYVTATRNTDTKAMYFYDEFVKDATGFNSSNKYYWPSDIGTYSLTFDAFWNVTPAEWTTTYEGKQMDTDRSSGGIQGYTVPDAAASQKDLLFARHTQTSKPADGGVLLNFRHMLSQVCVKVANDQANLKITITGVRVGFLNKVGTFIYTGSTTDTQESGADNATKIARNNWTLTDDASKDASYLFQQNVTSTELDGTAAAQDFAGAFTSWILMPQQLTAASAYTTAHSPAGPVDDSKKELNGAYLALKMAIVDKTTDAPIVAEQWCYWPIGTEWKPGFKYTYTINAGSGGYQPTDQDNNTDLDPVLDNTVIWFQPTCTIDEWVAEDYGVSSPIARTASYAFVAAASHTINLIAGANGAYDITITGLTEGHKVTAAGTVNFTASPTVSNSGTVPANGTLTITGNLTANTTATATSVITITDDNGTAGDTSDDTQMTISIVQAAP